MTGSGAQIHMTQSIIIVGAGIAGLSVGCYAQSMWQELGAVQGRRFINYDVFQRIEGSDGRDRAEAVISAADGHATIFDMLEGRYAGDKGRAAEP